MFRTINAHLQENILYTCKIWYCHSLRELMVASRYTAFSLTLFLIQPLITRRRPIKISLHAKKEVEYDEPI